MKIKQDHKKITVTVRPYTIVCFATFQNLRMLQIKRLQHGIFFNIQKITWGNCAIKGPLYHGLHLKITSEIT